MLQMPQYYKNREQIVADDFAISGFRCIIYFVVEIDQKTKSNTDIDFDSIVVWLFCFLVG